MTLTQALYKQICKERHFQLLLLTTYEELGNNVMTFDYDGISDCIHYIDDNEERRFMPWEIAEKEDAVHNELLNAIDANFIGGLELIDNDGIKDIMDFIKGLAVFKSINVMLSKRLDKYAYSDDSTDLQTVLKNNPLLLSELKRKLLSLRVQDDSTQIDDLMITVRDIDLATAMAGYRPVLTM